MEMLYPSLNVRMPVNDGFSYFGPIAAAIAGYEGEKLREDPAFWLTLVYSEDREKVAFLQEQLQKGVIPRGPHRIRWKHKEGYLVSTELWLIPVYREESALIAVEAIARDISRQEKMERELRARNKELEILNQIAYSDESTTSMTSFLSFSLEILLSAAGTCEGAIYFFQDNDLSLEICSDGFEKFCGRDILGNIDPASGEFFSGVWENPSLEWLAIPIKELNLPTGYCLIHWSPGERVNTAENQRMLKTALNGIGETLSRKRVEEKLRSAEEKYLKVMESISDGYYELDGSGNFTYFNHSFSAMLGFPKNELLKLNFADLFMNRQEYENVRAKVSTCGDNQEKIVCNLRRKDSQPLFAELSITPVKDNSGKLKGFHGVVCGVTEENKGGSLLKTSADHFRTLANFFPGVVYLAGRESNFPLLYINEAVEALLGYSREVFLEGKMRLMDLCFPRDVELVKKNIREAVKTRRPFDLILQVKDAREKWKWVREVGQGVYNGAGELQFIEGVILDVTGEISAEKKISYLHKYDRLTGLYNRNFFEETLATKVEKDAFPFSIITCDVDGLKLINDTLGHNTGDEILKAAGRIIKKILRPEDVAARVGGDEFAVFLPATPREKAEVVRREILHGVDKYNRWLAEIPLSLSTGVATADAVSHSAVDVFRKADNNMYREKLNRSAGARSTIVRALMATLAERDFITGGHAVRLQELVTVFGKAAGLQSHELNDLILLSQVHDIGKVGIPDNILFKNGNLTPEERERMKKHCEIGYRIARSSPELSHIAELILQHHEWWNGKGYPRGLKGEEIHICSRILAIVDAYDAMTSERPYQKPRSHLEALMELKRCKGEQFDPALVELFIKCISG